MTDTEDELADGEMEDPRGDDACPECDDGLLVEAGDPEHDTGHQSWACDASCGYAT